MEDDMTSMHPCSGLIEQLAPPESIVFFSEEYDKIYNQLRQLLEKVPELMEAENKAREVEEAIAELACMVGNSTMQKLIQKMTAGVVEGSPPPSATSPPPPTEEGGGDVESDAPAPTAEVEEWRDVAACVEENDCGDCRFDGYCQLQANWKEREIFPSEKWIRVEVDGTEIPTCTAQEDRDETVVSDPKNEGGELSLSVGARDIRIGGISEESASTLIEWGSRRGLFGKKKTKWVAGTLSIFNLDGGATEEVAGQLVAKIEQMAAGEEPAEPKGGDVTAEPISLPLPARVRDVRITMGRTEIAVEPLTAEAAAEIGNATVNNRIAQRWNYERMWSRLDMTWSPENRGTYPTVAQREIMKFVERTMAEEAPTMAEEAAAWLRAYKMREGKDCTTFELKKHFPLLEIDDLSGLGYAIDHGAIVPEGEELPPPPPDSAAVQKVKEYLVQEGKVRMSALKGIFADLEIDAIADILCSNDDFETHDGYILSPQELEAPFHQIRRFFVRGGTKSATLENLARVFPDFAERFGTTLGLLRLEPGFRVENGTLHYTPPEAEEAEEAEPEQVKLARTRIAEGFRQGNTIAFSPLEREVGEAALRHLERMKAIRITGEVKKTIRKGEAWRSVEASRVA